MHGTHGEEGGGFAAAFLSPSILKAKVIPNAVRNLFNDDP
ncbi:hypothetical protein FACS1894181_17350 [Bacteroidia bacterium]|nr:hypothetical protein FACS1894181_17350 [Bacteroidia bacterium]